MHTRCVQDVLYSLSLSVSLSLSLSLSLSDRLFAGQSDIHLVRCHDIRIDTQVTQRSAATINPIVAANVACIATAKKHYINDCGISPTLSKHSWGGRELGGGVNLEGRKRKIEDEPAKYHHTKPQSKRTRQSHNILDKARIKVFDAKLRNSKQGHEILNKVFYNDIRNYCNNLDS